MRGFFAMRLHQLAAAALFALPLVTSTLAPSAPAHAEEDGTRFLAQRLFQAGREPAFGLAPETWSQSVQDLAALLERVDGARAERARVVTLAQVVEAQVVEAREGQAREGRREVIEALARTVR